MANSIFISATEARQNPIRERIVFDEGSAISSAVLDAVRNGFFNATISNTTTMTSTTSLSAVVASFDSSSSTFQIPNHNFNSGDAVYLSSTGELSGPLKTDTLYYAIYVDRNHIRLAVSRADALAARPAGISLTVGVNSITLTDSGAGYTGDPTVTIAGGGAITDATAVAYLAPYGNLSYIVVNSPGSGYHYPPSVQIQGQGDGASVSSVQMQVVSFSINDGGLNYRVGDTLTATGGTGTASSFTITGVSNTGAVLTAILSSNGIYTSLPSLVNNTAVSPVGGTGCSLNLSFGLYSITVGTPGYQYTAPPVVLISGAGGIGAGAICYLTAGGVTEVTVTATGSGYTDIPTVSFTSGYGAAAVPYLVPTGVGAINLTHDGGNTYIIPPAVTITETGAGATAGTISMQINSATLITGGGGSQYAVGDLLLVAGGSGSATATIRVNQVDSAGSIVDYTLLTSGAYTDLPVMFANAVYGGTGSAASFDLTAGVHSIDIALGGTGYTTPPSVQIVGSGSGNGASAYTVLNGTSVSNIIMTASGTGFLSIPTVTITSGSGATAAALLSATGVEFINVDFGGSGYTTASVVITGTGTGVIATPNIVGGQIVSITVNQYGHGFTAVPTVMINGDGSGASATAQLQATSLAGISILTNGAGYNSIPTVQIDGSATATASLSATGLEQIIISTGGEYYTSAPIVSVIPDPQDTIPPISPATTAIRGFSIATVLITSQGIGYTSVPTVTISAPENLSGHAATADATIGYGSGTMSVKPYPASLDYYLVYQGLIPSDPNLARPYKEQMDTVVNYFTNLGYTITRQLNTDTNNTFNWLIKW
jgi:hypothetical protein